jgi:hypothetical protein
MKLAHRLAVTVAAAATVSLASACAASSATGSEHGQRAAASPQSQVAQGFRPISASFLSQSAGYALGGVNCRPDWKCPAWLARTADGGARWKLMPVPGLDLGQASQVLFASPRTGWIYGTRQLWATSDGGQHWQLDRGTGALAIVAAGPRVFAVLTRDRGITRPAGLYFSPVSHTSWSLVRSLAVAPAVLASYRDTAWFAPAATRAGKSVIWTSTAGGRWHRRPFQCPGRYYTLSSIAAASTSHLAYLCTETDTFGMSQEGMKVLVSANGGRTARLAGHWVPTIVGDGGVLVMAPGNPRMITFAAPPNAIGILGRSANGGRTWHPIGPGKLGTWNSLAYTSRTTGYLVADVPPSTPQGSRLLRTTNAGRTWQPIRFTPQRTAQHV